MWGGHGGRRLIQTCVEDHGVLPASRQQLEVSEKSFSRQLDVEVGQRQSGRPQHGSGARRLRRTQSFSAL